MFARVLVVPPLDVARLLGVLVLLPRVAVLAAGPPVLAARLATLARLPRPLVVSPRPPLAVGPRRAAVATRLLRRLPQLPAREPLHRRVRMFLAQPLKRRHQLVA